MIELRKAGRQLAAAASRSGYDNQRLRYLDIRIGPVAFFADDGFDIRRIALREAVFVGFDVSALQFINKAIDCRSVLVSGYNDAVDLQIMLAKNIDQTQDLQVVGDTEILTGLAVDDIAGINADDDLRLILHALQQFDLRVFVKTGQYAHRVLVMHQLAAKL